MKKIRVLFFIPLLLLTLCSVASSAHKPTRTGTSNPVTEADTVEIDGKFLAPCYFPHSVKIAMYNVAASPFEDIEVNAAGEFTYRLFIKYPKQAALRLNTTVFEFMISPNEKVYHLEINCDENGHENVSIINSNENKAFLPFNELSKNFRTALGKFSGSNVAGKDTFAMVVKLISDYQNQISDISKNNRGTFTGDILCASVLIPKSALNSISTLREKFLQPQFFGNPQFYYNFLPSSIFINYWILLGSRDTSFAWVEKVMDVALKNPEAGKLFQQTLYNLLYNLHKEQLFSKYIIWANQHPGGILDPAVKINLQEAQKSMPGVLAADFELEDTTGALKKLSQTVASSKLTLLIFYSPTCEHCQQQLPQLLPLWNKYKNEGLKIYAVACESEKNEWRDFIHEKATEEWTNVYEPPGITAPSVAQYNIHDYPKYIILNNKGVIISRFNNLGIILEEIPKEMANVR